VTNDRPRGSIGCIALLTLVCSATASSQSTSDVGVVDKPQRLEISAGQEFHSRSGPPDNFSQKSLRSASISIRRDRLGNGGFRFTLRGYDLTREIGYSDVTTTYTYADNDYVVGLTAASDWMFHVTPNLTVAPSTGLGVVPFARTTHTSSSNGFNPPAANSMGLMWTSGIAVRYGHVVVEQDLTGVVGAIHDMISTAFMPIMIGWRF